MAACLFIIHLRGPRVGAAAKAKAKAKAKGKQWISLISGQLHLACGPRALPAAFGAPLRVEAAAAAEPTARPLWRRARELDHLRRAAFG